MAKSLLSAKALSNGSSRPRRNGALPICLPYLLLTASLAANIYLLAPPITTPASGAHDTITLKKGTPLPALAAVSLDGTPTSVRCPVGKDGILVYVFSPTCRWCDLNAANIVALARSLKSKYHVVGVSLSEENLSEYISHRNLLFPVLIRPSSASRATYEIHSTPMTYVLSREGVLVEAWAGAYNGRVRSAIERKFGIHLPGLVR